jgi:DNA-binding transcriptional regulator YhcF (GntR family)
MSMVSSNEQRIGNEQSKSAITIHRYSKPNTLEVSRLARELFAGRFRAGQLLDLRVIAEEYQIDFDLVLKTFAEFQSLGMVTISGGFSAVVYSPNPKEMQEAYEVRAAIEEIAGRAAAKTLKGNTARLRTELDAMRAALKVGDLDALRTMSSFGSGKPWRLSCASAPRSVRSLKSFPALSSLISPSWTLSITVAQKRPGSSCGIWF